MSLKTFYNNKKIFLTGHTGFKGAWLALFLKELGAEVTAFALQAEDIKGNLFNLTALEREINSVIGDLRDINSLKLALKESEAEIVFHLAAQPLVRRSYNNPINTYESNVIGTVNLFEAVKDTSNIKAIVNITTDKCYESQEWHWSYRENDKLGGHDPYSTSKACVELITNSYRKSFFAQKAIGLASARAGNVIGGGDFSQDRIIPDIIEAIENKEKVILRHPQAIRPWQHVLDVLNGYLILGKNLYNNPQKFSEPFNFSPIENKVATVEDLTKIFIEFIGEGSYKIDQKKLDLHETKLLKLDPQKAVNILKWQPYYDVEKSLEKTAIWYKEYLINKNNIILFTKNQLKEFISLI